MASSSKKKTTFAKLNREAKVRERRQLKEARRAARKLEAQKRSDTLSEPVSADLTLDAPQEQRPPSPAGLDPMV